MVASPMVPVVVIAPPVMPLLVATLVTVPVPLTVCHAGLAAAPPVARTCPLVPGASATQALAFRYRICPCVVPIKSRTLVADKVEGTAVPPELFPRTELLLIDGS